MQGDEVLIIPYFWVRDEQEEVFISASQTCQITSLVFAKFAQINFLRG